MNKAIWFAGLVLLSGMAMAAMPDHGRQEPARSFAEGFRHVDTNHDGLMSLAETEKNAPGLALRFAQIDANHDGQLSEREIRDFVHAFVVEQRKKFAKRFKHADRDGNGSLSREEAKALPGVLAHYDQMDADHNGELTPAEIGRYVRARIEKRRRAGGASGAQQ